MIGSRSAIPAFLAGGLGVGLAGGLALGFGFAINWYVFYFRISFYPYHFIKSFFIARLDSNVYLKDAVIWLPIWGLKKKLFQDAYQRPEIAKQFVGFLLEYRPLQRELAMDILHAATAGEWKANVLNADYLNSPKIAEEQKKKYQPSNEWLDILEQTKENFQSSETQNQAWLRQQTFEQFFNLFKSSIA